MSSEFATTLRPNQRSPGKVHLLPRLRSRWFKVTVGNVKEEDTTVKGLFFRESNFSITKIFI
jgi:hypothetical protein